MVQFRYSRIYIGMETVSCHLLLRMARMDMDETLKKLGQLFQVLMLRGMQGNIRSIVPIPSSKPSFCVFCEVPYYRKLTLHEINANR